MPYASEHSARVRDPGDFIEDSFRRKNIDTGVDLVMGKLTSGDGSMTAQAYRFDADKFSASEAKKWLKDHDVEYVSFEKASESKDFKNMETAVLKIYGDIGEKTDPMEMMLSDMEAVSAKIVSEFLEENKDAKSLTVHINSRGGDVQEGWAIYDLLINSGKKIKTIGEGKVYSIATIVFLAGEEREIMQNADGLIHNPFIPPYTLADQYESGDLIKIAESLIQEEEKILDFYVKKTGSPKERLAELMKEDTKLSAEDMLSLGFATKIIEPVKAYAYIKPTYKMNPEDVKKFGQKLDILAANVQKILGLSRVTPADLKLKDKDGKEFVIQKESGDPAVGDKASPDGTFVMEDGRTITIADGVVKEVKAAGKTELDLAKEKITQLEAEIQTMKAERPDLVTAEAEMKRKTTEAQGLVTELSNLKNSWKPEGRTKFSSAEKVGSIDLTRVKEIIKNKKEKQE